MCTLQKYTVLILILLTFSLLSFLDIPEFKIDPDLESLGFNGPVKSVDYYNVTSSDTGFMKEITQRIEFDTAGKRLALTNFKKSIKYKYLRDTSGQLIEAIVCNFKGDIGGRYSYIYENNRFIQYIFQGDSGLSYAKRTYDKNGNISMTEEYNLDGTYVKWDYNYSNNSYSGTMKYSGFVHTFLMEQLDSMRKKVTLSMGHNNNLGSDYEFLLEGSEKNPGTIESVILKDLSNDKIDTVFYRYNLIHSIIGQF